MELKFGYKCAYQTSTNAVNRTKWNWNVLAGDLKTKISELLIVPNGIEIVESCLSWLILVLLIVPNGIEIKRKMTQPKNLKTVNRTKWNWNLIASPNAVDIVILLIVPNGIEIRLD